MAITLYTANTAVAPLSDGWTLNSGTAPTSDGTKWVASTTVQIRKTGFTWNTGKSYLLITNIKIISTSASYHGLGFWDLTTNNQFVVGSRWEQVNKITNWNGSATLSALTTSSSGLTFTAAVEITGTGSVNYYANGTLFKTETGRINNGDNIILFYNRYTGATAENINSVLLEDTSSSSPTPNFFPFLLAHST